MKSKVTQKEKKSDKPFPKLMISKSTGRVVLFEKSKVGNVVYEAGAFYALMEFREDWIMDDFTDFEGTVTLSND